MAYAELLACSNFSFQHGASHAHELIRRAKELGYAAIALTDECTLAGIVRAYEAAIDVGIPLIIGSQFRLPEGDRVALLAPTQEAYSQLCEFITRARRAATKGQYRVTREDFSNGLSACFGIWLPGARPDKRLAEWFLTLSLEMHAFGFTHSLAQDSAQRLARLEALANALNTAVVAVGDVHYHVRDRRALHDVLTAIRLGRTVDQVGRAGFANGEYHLRPLSTLRRLYPPQLIAKTLEIAAQCQFSLEGLRYEYPRELVPSGRSAIEHLRVLTEEGLMRRWPLGTPQSVRALIEKELRLIEELKFEAYFLTVEDVVRFARGRAILCQGRGSAANSVVCYALGITEVDPQRVSMLFERFVSAERRHEPPDIDIDFEHQRREEVIQYIYTKYGRERAALAATVITYRRRLAVRDVGKALGLPADIVDSLAKSLYWFGGNELPDQLARLGFDPSSRVAQHLFTLVSMLIGFPRHLSQHVGGFVISEHPLSELVPVENAAMPGRTIIQWDKNDIETLRLLKVDCLCLGMLSAIRRALELKSHFEGKPFRLQDIPSEDAQTYEMLCRGDSTGVFQVESRAQMAMLPRLKPKEYFDLVVQIAIIRPGPIQGGMVHPYLRRRQGLEPVSYPSAELERVLGRTLGVPLFQEQVMEIAMVAAGFSAGEADKVRRSMGAWERRGGLEQFRARLIGGMLARNYSRGFAESIFQQILGFGAYGFPQAHAASFALLAYASAWLRCYHHAAFVAGLLNSQPMGFYAPAQLIGDARRHGVVFRPVDVQVSNWDCTLERHESGAPEVRLGFRMVAGLREAEGVRIAVAREEGVFADVESLAYRAQLNRRALSLLARANALSALSGHRRAAHWHAIGIERLPGILAGASAREPPVTLRAPSEADDLVADYQSMGLTLGRHPLALLRRSLNALKVRRAEELPGLPSGRAIRVAGLVTHRQRPETASGVIFMSLEDESGVVNVIVWPSVQRTQRQATLASRLLIVQGELQSECGVIHVIAEKLKDYTHWLGSLRTHSRDFH